MSELVRFKCPTEQDLENGWDFNFEQLREISKKSGDAEFFAIGEEEILIVLQVLREMGMVKMEETE